MLRLRSNQGFLTVGNVKSTDVEWGDWQLFSSTGAAFAPKLAVKLQDEGVKALRLTMVTINYKWSIVWDIYSETNVLTLLWRETRQNQFINPLLFACVALARLSCYNPGSWMILLAIAVNLFVLVTFLYRYLTWSPVDISAGIVILVFACKWSLCFLACLGLILVAEWTSLSSCVLYI